MRILQVVQVFSLYSQLPTGRDELRKHIESLSRMANQREHQELFSHLYECLSILDSKSSSLLSFNSIIIAVFAIFMTGELVWFEWIAVSVGMATILVSCLLLLWVVWIHWSTTENLANPENHALVLLDVRRGRTIQFRLAWYLAVTSVICLIVFLLLHVLRVQSSAPAALPPVR